MLEKFQFNFHQRGYGLYLVSYTTGRGDSYLALIDNMSLIEDVKYQDYPTQAALKRLARAVRFEGSHFSKNGELLDS